MTERLQIRAYLVDDEALAIRRLSRMLEATGRVEIVGSSTDPGQAIRDLEKIPVDALFLDIEMPDMTGFELLSHLGEHPPVVFTTAYDRYALRAFEVDSVDYLLKPVERAALDRALARIDRYRAAGTHPNLQDVVKRLAESIRHEGYRVRLPSRLGDRVQFVEVDRVSHFYAHEKLTYAATNERDYVVDHSITELERLLDPDRFVRIHRSVLLNVAHVHEVQTGFSGRATVRLRNADRTELRVARDRIRALRDVLGF